MECPLCHGESSDTRVCTQCGREITYKCAACVGQHTIGAVFCPETKRHIEVWVAAKKEAAERVRTIREDPIRRVGQIEARLQMLLVFLSIIGFAAAIAGSCFLAFMLCNTGAMNEGEVVTIAIMGGLGFAGIVLLVVEWIPDRCARSAEKGYRQQILDEIYKEKLASVQAESVNKHVS